MKVLQVLASWGQGGLEKHVLDLAASLAHEHEVHVIVDERLAPRFSSSVFVHPVDFTRSRWSPRLWLQLFLLIHHIKPDVIHAQANKAVALMAVIKRIFGKIPMVGTLHNQKRRRRLFRQMDYVIAVSPGLVSVGDFSRWRAIYNGIQPSISGDCVKKAVLLTETVLDPEKPVLLSVGRLVEAKGFDILIDAAAMAGVQVAIVGDGPLRHQLAHQITEKRAPVALLGYRQDVPQLMRAFDGFVLSSRREGFAYVVVEALHAKMPMVATNIPMMAGLVPPIWQVDVESVASLASAMKMAVADLPAWRTAMEPSFAMAERELTLEAMTRETLNIYEMLMKGAFQ